MATRRGFLGGASAVGAATVLASGAQPAFAAGPAPMATKTQARNAVRAVNSEMRSNYAALKSDLIQQLSPVIVVQNNSVGSRFTLIHEGREQDTVDPVPEKFELAKSVAHVPLGIFSVLAGFLADKVPGGVPNAGRIDAHDLEMVAMRNASSDAWIAPLQAYGETLTTAKDGLGDTGLPADLEKSCRTILTEALSFIDASVKAKSFDIPAFQDFTERAYPSIRVNMEHASQAQISGIQGLLDDWRALVGEAAWKEMYTVVLSMWTTSVLNQASIIIRPKMDQDRVDTHLIDLAAAESPSDPVFVALDNLARIVQDNIAAEMVFVADTVVADALKGKQDLLSDEILDQLGTEDAVAAQSAVQSTAATYNTTSGASLCPVGH